MRSRGDRTARASKRKLQESACFIVGTFIYYALLTLLPIMRFASSLLLVCLFVFLPIRLCADSFLGTLSQVVVNKKTYPSLSGQRFTLMHQSEKRYLLRGQIGPIGKMPGRVEIELPLSEDDGLLLPLVPEGTDIGGLRTKMGPRFSLCLTHFSGTLREGRLNFALSVYGKLAFVTVARTSFVYTGQMR